MNPDEKVLIKHELIGLNAEIIDSNNKANIGISGTIEDETKNTIVIGGKRLMKNNITIKVRLDGKEITIKGSLLSGKPKERIKNE